MPSEQKGHRSGKKARKRRYIVAFLRISELTRLRAEKSVLFSFLLVCYTIEKCTSTQEATQWDRRSVPPIKD